MDPLNALTSHAFTFDDWIDVLQKGCAAGGEDAFWLVQRGGRAWAPSRLVPGECPDTGAPEVALVMAPADGSDVLDFDDEGRPLATQRDLLDYASALGWPRGRRLFFRFPDGEVGTDRGNTDAHDDYGPCRRAFLVVQ